MCTQAEFAQLCAWWAELLGHPVSVKVCSSLDRPPTIALQVSRAPSVPLKRGLR